MSGETATLGMQGFGAGASTVGAYFNAQGQKSTLNTQADLADINSKLADMSAQSALLAGQRQEQAVDLNTANIKSKQKVAFNANGIDANSDTVNRVITSTDVLGSVDAATVAANAMRTAFGYQTQSVNYKNQAIGERATAGAINPFFTAAGTLVTDAGSVAQSWYKFKKDGAFSQTGPIGPQNDIASQYFGQHNLVSDALF